MKQILCCLALLCLFCNATAQSQNKTKGLAIGDTLPGVALPNVINYPGGQLNTADFKGQLLILDFWTTWCTPCIAMFPKTDSLNKVFNGQATILPVTHQTKDEVARLFNKLSILRSVKLPIVTSDEKLNTMFPHSEVPHYVWIDKQGGVKAITGHKEVNAENIKKMLTTSSVSFTEKKDPVILPYDRNTPLMFNPVEISADDLQYESILLKYKEGFSSRIDAIRYPDQATARITATNVGLRTLYAWAFSTIDLALPNTRIIVESADSSIINFPHYKSETEVIRKWVVANSYCYELMVPQSIANSFHAMMKQDLTRLFPKYTVTLEKRETKTLAIVRTSSIDKVKTSGGKSGYSEGEDFVLTNYNLRMLINKLNYTLQLLEIPVVDDTAYKGNVDLSLTCNLSNVESIRTALKKYDMDLIYQTKAIDMLVIRDTK